MYEIEASGRGKLVNPQNAETMNSEYFLEHYLDFIRPYIAKGLPSTETMTAYGKAVDAFLVWCRGVHIYPLNITEYNMRIYLGYLREQGLSEIYIEQKLAAIKCLMNVAIKFGFIAVNPAKDLGTKVAAKHDSLFHYYTPEQLSELQNGFNECAKGNMLSMLRNKAILYLMAVEGLRCIEVHRMNYEDINWNDGVIMIRGKGSFGRQDPIFPCAETMGVLMDYWKLASAMPIKSENVITPFIISLSARNIWGRISRTGLRLLVNNAMTASGLKKKGHACHTLRHSCGSNLYAETKDIRLVQETLRHRSPDIAARYAHIQSRLAIRRTSSIIPSDDKL